MALTCRSRAYRTYASSTGYWAGSPKPSRTGETHWNLAGQLRHAHTLGYAFAHVCALHTLERDVQTVETLAQRALVGAIKRELPLWISVARPYLGWCEVESGRLAEGIETLEKQRDFLQLGAPALLASHLPVLAGRGVCPRRKTERRQALSRAGARTSFGRGGNYWYEVECLRIEGRLAAHPQINDAKKAEQCFEQALTLARQRGQRGFALRAAHGLADHLAGNGQPERARELLEEELKFFTDQPDRGDRVDAKALLCSLQGASPARTSHS